MVKNQRVFVNRSIRSPKVRCIDQNDENIGIVFTSHAISLAEKVGLDLVQISNSKNDEAPTCKIVDYGKYKYDLSKKQKLNAKKQRESIVKVKEVKLRPTTDLNDLKIKSKLVHKFLDEGFKVKVAVFLKGRENQNKWFAQEKLDLFMSMVDDGSFRLSTIKFDDKNMSVLIAVDDKREATEKAS